MHCVMSFTEQQVEDVVRTNVQDKDLLTPIEDPYAVQKCVHGTYLKNWESIWNLGLCKMQRNHIHFAENEVVDDQV
ncbi:rna 2-tpt1 family protein [Plasmopara halstedii]|uniref:Rna 2-tpt1 family protein n=1 Tax=Plasmopara halstedii TaxID=4781 RepID=A0A0P1B026_PLAHL|nr:rna 2-tpt1 family protein [Plasmopara halstedii]CEG46600.1 rna 2-tpt1 family protein [Plasmopara halstedii]|eukprot:XP_024582969.1 rna 2-tpt1 family protein [Plasmopara halstedii]